MEIRPDIRFYDTCSLLELDYENYKDNFVISSITLQELENIKTSYSKSDKIKYQARKLTKWLKDNRQCEVWIYKSEMLAPILEAGLEVSDDTKILACVIDYDNKVRQDETVFVTNDLCLYNIARLFFGNGMIEMVERAQEIPYRGYMEISVDEKALEQIYSDPNSPLVEYMREQGYINEYVLVKLHDEIVDKFCWTGEVLRPVKFYTADSAAFGRIKPYNNDPYQALAFDSFYNNQVTMICGKAGSGKTYLALGYLFSLLEHNVIDHIVVFCNPVVAKNAAKLGYYPGSVLEKLMASQVGAVLASKLGSPVEVERLIQSEKLILVPVGDARGYQTPPHSGVYVMESQNLTSDLLRLILQRITDDSKVIVDGDYNEQVDMEIYAQSNGMKSMSEVFRGSHLYGQVELQQIHRSEIAQLADLMR